MSDNEKATGTHGGTEADSGAVYVRRSRQPGDVVNKNTADLPDHQRSALRWLHAHADTAGLSNKEIGKLIGYSDTVISRIFGEKLSYEGNLDDVCEAIGRAKTLIEARASIQKAPFIECQLSRHMWKICRASLEYQRMAFFFGESQIGKTTILKEYARRHNHGETIYVEMPVGGALSNFLANLSLPLRMSVRKKVQEIRRRVIESFDGRMLLIVDQCHRAFSSQAHGMAPFKTLDFLIEIFDYAGCGIVLSGTNVFRDSIKDEVHKKFLNQLRRRGLNTDGFQLPDEPSRADLNAFARHYELAPASGEALELQTRIIKHHGLGVWLMRLTMAQRRALTKKRTLTWEDVRRAEDWLNARAAGPVEREEESGAS